MRLWSISCHYLDQQGLCGLWRESLLCQAVLLGQTKGYKNHPQLDRWKKLNKPIEAIGHYLMTIHEEGLKRGYKFNFGKIVHRGGLRHDILTVTTEQIKYEWKHLENKLNNRHSQTQFDLNCIYTNYGKNIESNPIFNLIEGKIEDWERIK